MTRIAAAVCFVLLASFGCNKPSDSACRKAIANMRSLIGTDSPTSNTDIEGDVRRCKGGSKKKAVECAAAAKTIDELRACDFMKIPSKAHDSGSSGSGSASTPTPTPTPDPGSAAGSSAAPGSAAAGSATGAGDMSGSSATGSGSAAGSSAAGSAAAGSDTGSAAGSATK